MKRKIHSILFICLAAMAISIKGNSQSINEFEIKAVFIYNFTQFIQWPSESFENAQDAFVIGVLGENVFGKYLEEAVAGETYQSRPIVIKYFSSKKDVGNCHILYVGSSTNISDITAGRPILTVGERPEFMEQKGLLRFYHQDNKVRIEVNQAAAGAAGLVISSKLLRLATIYKEK